MRLATHKIREKVTSALGSGIRFLLKQRFVLASDLLGTVSASVLCSSSAVVAELLSAERERKILSPVL